MAPTRTIAGPTRTVTVTKRSAPTKVTHYVTKTVTPDVPTGAFLPSKHQAVTQRSFTVSDGNVSCSFAGGGVRCEVQQRVWAPPVQPADCTSNWGNTLALHGSGQAAFLCGTTAATPADAQVIPDGWDDSVGQTTCQVRSFAVNCFSRAGRGFIISGTGYQLY